MLPVLCFSARSPFLPILLVSYLSCPKGSFRECYNLFLYFLLMRRTFLPGLVAVCGVLPGASFDSQRLRSCCVRRTASGAKETQCTEYRTAGSKGYKLTLLCPYFDSNVGNNKPPFASYSLVHPRATQAAVSMHSLVPSLLFVRPFITIHYCI